MRHIILTDFQGGHLRPDLYGHIPMYIERFGVEAAAELAEFEIAHVHAIKETVEKEKIDCDFTITRTTDVWCNQSAADKAKGVYDKMVAHGLKYMNDVDFTMGKDAPGVCATSFYSRHSRTNNHRSAESTMQRLAQPTPPVQSFPTSSFYILSES